MKRPPLFWINFFLLIVLLPSLVLDNWQAFTQEAVPHVAPRYWGNDYRFFFGASRSIWQGDSPYGDYFFTSPPLAAFLNLPLVGLIFEQAFPIFSVIGAASCLISLWLMVRRLITSSQIWCFCLLVVALLAGLPFQFLVSRGNTDGVVLILVVAAIFFISQFGICSGVLFGVAASLKFYPIILLLPLLAFRKWCVAVAMLEAISILALLTWPHWMAFLSRLATRSQEFRIDENISLVAALVSSLSSWLSFGVCKQIAATIFIGLLALQLFADWHHHRPADKDDLAAGISLYLPLMISVPSLVFNYEAIFVVAAVPAVVWLGLRKDNPAPAWLIVLMLVGAALTQFQSVWAFQLLGSGATRFLPAWGLFILIAAISIYRFVSLNKLKNNFCLR